MKELNTMTQISREDFDLAVNLVLRMDDAQYSGFVKALNQMKKADRQAKAAQVLASLSKGDRVKILAGKPQYLTGRTGTIVEVRQTRLTVELDCGPIGKFHNGRVITPASLLEKIS